MFRVSTSTYSSIGIDVGPRYLSAVQLNGKSNNRRVAAAVMLPRCEFGHLPSSAELDRLLGVLNRSGFSGRRIVLAAPLEKAFGSVLDLPRGSGIAQSNMARIELARAHRCPPDAFEVGCWDLPTTSEGAKSIQVMAVALRHNDADALLNGFESAGFDVEAIDARSCALARAAALLPSAEIGMTAIVELDWRFASLVLVHRGIAIYERRLADSELQRVHDSLCKRLHLEAEVADYLLMEIGLGQIADETPVPRQARAVLSAHMDAVAAELSASLAYVRQQYPDVAIDRLLLCGHGATMPGAQQRLADVLRTATSTISPATMFTSSRPRHDAANSPVLVTAASLAMFDD